MNDAPRKQLARLAEVLGGRVKFDACRDPVIEGRRGNIHADGSGYSVAVMLDTGRRWYAAKARLRNFCRLTQDGDTEGVLYLPCLPTPQQAVKLRHVLGIRKRPTYSPATLAAMRRALEKVRKTPGSFGTSRARTNALAAKGVLDQSRGEALQGPRNPMERQGNVLAASNSRTAVAPGQGQTVPGRHGGRK